jgi:hypothetical protein
MPPRKKKVAKEDEPPAWDKIEVPDEWSVLPLSISFQAGFRAGWENPKAKNPLPEGPWPYTLKRKEGWNAGKVAGAKARRERVKQQAINAAKEAENAD